MTLQQSMPAAVQAVFAQAPKALGEKLLQLRDCLVEVSETAYLDTIEETLTWGQPSYLTKHGSTIRIGWHSKTPLQYGVYFHCQSKLIETFKAVYGDIFRYDGNRAIVFDVHTEQPKAQLRHCIATALRYHQVKQLPLLGMS